MFDLLLLSMLSFSTMDFNSPKLGDSISFSGVVSGDDYDEYNPSAPKKADHFNSCFGLTNSRDDVCDYIISTKYENGKDVITVDKLSKVKKEVYERIQTMDYPIHIDGNLVGLNYVMCFTDNKPEPHMLALVKFDNIDEEISGNVLYAWRFDFYEQKMKVVDIKSISCHNPGYGI